MTDLTRDDMFAEDWFENRQLVPGMALGALDRKKILEHVIQKVVSETLSKPGANPVGFTLTVNLADVNVNDDVMLEVFATTPQYSADPARTRR